MSALRFLSLSHDTVLSGLSSLIIKPRPSSHGRVFFFAFLTSLVRCICRNTTVLHRACSLAFNQPQLPHLSLAADTAECQLAAASALLCLETTLFQDGFLQSPLLECALSGRYEVHTGKQLLYLAAHIFPTCLPPCLPSLTI